MNNKNIKITAEDMIELTYSGQLICFDNILQTSSDCKIEKKIGVHSHKIALFNGFRIQEFHSRMNKNIQIEMKSSLDPVLNLQFMQQGVLQYSTQNKTITQTGGRNYQWIIPSELYGSISYRKDTDYTSFEIGIENDYLERFVNRFPDLLTNLYLQYQSGNFWGLNGKEQHFTSCEMNVIISQIKNARLMGNAAGLYIEAKILELLALQLRRKEYPEQWMCNLCCKRKSDIEKIHEARNILLSRLNDPPSIMELSKEVGINDNKLKYGFKEVFNQTVYGCLFEHKMELAGKLLLDMDKTIGEVAEECGYEYASHFTNAFKRKYGVSPSEFRKKSS